MEKMKNRQQKHERSKKKPKPTLARGKEVGPWGIYTEREGQD